jgi:predicted dienelactone hydrolase
VFFSQRGARDLVAAVQALAGGQEHVATVDRRSGPAVATLHAIGDRIRVFSICPDADPLDLPGFELDRDQQASKRDVDPDEAVAAVRAVLDAHPAGAERPLVIDFGAERPPGLVVIPACVKDSPMAGRIRR